MTIKPTGNGYQVVSKQTGKPLSKPNLSKAAAEKRVKQIHYFQQRKGH